MSKIIKTWLMLLLLCLPLTAFGSDQLPDLKGSYLSIPWSDFKGLLDQIAALEIKTTGEEPPPAPWLITAASYQGRTLADAAAFDFTMKITVLEKEQWVMVPVLAAQLALSRLDLDGSPVLAVTRDGYHQIILKGAGDHTLTGRFYLALDNQLGPRAVKVPLTQTPVTVLDFTVDEPGLDLKAEPASLTRSDTDGKVSRLHAVLPPTSWVTVTMTKKLEAEKAELRVNAQVESLVSLGERLCRVQSTVHYEILHRGLDTLELTLPAAATVVDVQGLGLADWKAAKDGDKQSIKVTLSYEASNRYDLTVIYEVALAGESAEVAVPALATKGASRERGNIGVAARTNLEVEVKVVKGLASLDPSELPAPIASASTDPIVYAFKYVAQPWEMALKVTRHEDVEGLPCAADSLQLTSFLTKDGELVTQASYVIRNNREQFIRLTLPLGARLFSTFRNGAPVKPSRDKDGRYLVPLEKATDAAGMAQAFTLEITYLTTQDKLKDGRGSITLQAPTSDVMTKELKWEIFAPKDYRWKVKDSTLEDKTVEGKVVDLGPVAMDESKRDRAELLVAQVTNVATLSEGKVTASLPVRFNVPRSGVELDLEKSIVVEGEVNSAILKYKKINEDLDKCLKDLKYGLIGFVVLALVVMQIWFIQRRVRAVKKAARAGGAS